MFKYYLILIIIMSTITLIFYIIDKEKAKRNKYRIREKTLVLLSFLYVRLTNYSIFFLALICILIAVIKSLLIKKEVVQRKW